MVIEHRRSLPSHGRGTKDPPREKGNREDHMGWLRNIAVSYQVVYVAAKISLERKETERNTWDDYGTSSFLTK